MGDINSPGGHDVWVVVFLMMPLWWNLCTLCFHPEVTLCGWQAVKVQELSNHVFIWSELCVSHHSQDTRQKTTLLIHCGKYVVCYKTHYIIKHCTDNTDVLTRSNYNPLEQTDMVHRLAMIETVVFKRVTFHARFSPTLWRASPQQR